MNEREPKRPAAGREEGSRAYDAYEIAQGWSDVSFGSFSKGQAATFEADLRRLVRTRADAWRILDVGFGNGPFMGWCRQRGWECDGVEVNPRLVERAIRHGYRAAETLDALRAQPGWRPYDLVTAFDVLEHIECESLVPFLKSVSDVCDTDACIVLRFPNGDNPFSLPVQNGDVTHRSAIGQAMLRQIAALAGLEVVWLGSPVVAVEGLGLKRRLLAAVGVPVRNVIGWGIRHLFMGGMAANFSGNLLAVLALPRR